MEGNLGNHSGLQIPPSIPQSNPFGNAIYGASSGLIRGGLEAYGEKFLGSSSNFMQRNASTLILFSSIYENTVQLVL